MRISCLLAVTFAVMLGQAALRATAGDQDPLDLPSVAPPGQPRDLKLPNGKSQRDEIVKADYKKNLQDAAGLVELSGEIRDELKQSDAYIVPLKTVKKLEDLEKLSRNIRGRLKRN
jgi:hypothetical protein